MQQEEIKKNDDFTIEKKWFVKLNEGKIEDYYDTSSQIVRKICIIFINVI